MKNGINSILPVRLRLNISDIESVIFLFKQENSNTAPEILRKTYPDDVNYNSEKNYFELPISESESWLFTGDKPFYMDTKVTLTSGYNPQTPIVTLRMHPTLFPELADEGDPEEEEDVNNEETTASG